MRVNHLTSVNVNRQSELQKLTEENARLKVVIRALAAAIVLLGVLLAGRPW